MVKTCVAAGCNNSNQDGVSLHKFPSNSALRKKWVDQVKRHRDKWEPTAYSVLHSQYFEPSCFMADSILSQSLGLGKKRACLKPDAVPTLFSKPVCGKRKVEWECLPPKKRSAFEKRERCRVSEMNFFKSLILSTMTGCRGSNGRTGRNRQFSFTESYCELFP